MKKAIDNMKNGKAGGPSGITAEHFKYLNEEGIRWVTVFLNKIMEEEEIPAAWNNSSLVTIYKEKGNHMWSVKTTEE